MVYHNIRAWFLNIVACADVAQSVERILGKDEVTGSNPVISSIEPVRNGWFFVVLEGKMKGDRADYAFLRLHPLKPVILSVNPSANAPFQLLKTLVGVGFQGWIPYPARPGNPAIRMRAVVSSKNIRPPRVPFTQWFTDGKRPAAASPASTEKPPLSSAAHQRKTLQVIRNNVQTLLRLPGDREIYMK